jgi:putative spermidine/putrescine transport system permease protein
MSAALTAGSARGWRPGPLWLAVPGLLFLLVFLLVPCARLLSLSVQDVNTGEFSLAAFRRAFGVAVYIRVLSSTFWIAFQTTALCLLLGYPLAYWLARQPARRQGALALLVLFPFWTSTLVKSFIWIVLLGHTGPIVLLFQALGVTEPPELLFSRPTVVLAMAHTMLPLAVVTMLPTLNQIDPRLALAAETMGATRIEAFWRVTFQLSMPGVAAAGLLVFIASLGFFITPALLGGPRDTMLGQVIIQQILSQQNWTFAGALSVMLVGSALLSCLVYDRLFGLSGMGGGTSRAASDRWSRRFGLWLLARVANASAVVARLGGQRRTGWILPVYAWTLIVVLLLPILACIPMAFTSSSFLSFPPPGYSARWFGAYFGSPVWMAATARSFGIGLASACLTLLIAAPAAFGMARSAGRLSGMVFLVFLAPLVIPGVVMAVGLFYLFAQIGLVATDLGIVLGHTITGIPLAFVILLAQLRQYDWRLNQAAGTLGAGRAATLRRVMAPLVKGGLVAAFIFAFLNSFEELTVALFIGGGLKVTLPRQMWDDINLQVTPTLAAASLVVLAVVTGLFIAGERLRAAPAR